MSSETALIIIGVLVAFSPYLGLPLAMLGFLLPALGIIIVAVGALLRARNHRRSVQMIETVPSHEAQEA